MTSVIHRHQVPGNGILRSFSLPIYADAEIVHFGRTRGAFQVWEAHLADVVRPAVVPQRRFIIAGTGDLFEGDYVATTIAGVDTVWHLIEVAG